MPQPPLNSRDLPTIQQWFQAVITSAEGVSRGVDSSAAKGCIDISAAEIEGVILPSQKRSSLQRLEVYANAYFARLTECLQAIYPIFAQTVGEELFAQFALRYLQLYPSRSYTLNRLGDHFVEFLNETRPAETSDAPDWIDFIICLARLEWGIDQVFDGAGYEGKPVIAPDQLQQLSPEAFWNAQAELVPCLQLFAFPFPINDYFTATKRSGDAQVPSPQPTWLALSRRDFIVRRIPLTSFEHALLAQMVRGLPIGESIEAALTETEETENLPEVLAATFQKLAAEQLILAIKTAS